MPTILRKHSFQNQTNNRRHRHRRSRGEVGETRERSCPRLFLSCAVDFECPMINHIVLKKRIRNYLCQPRHSCNVPRPHVCRPTEWHVFMLSINLRRVFPRHSIPSRPNQPIHVDSFRTQHPNQPNQPNRVLPSPAPWHWSLGHSVRVAIKVRVGGPDFGAEQHNLR